MEKMRVRRFFTQLIVSLALLLAPRLWAESYYWENPVRVSQSGACFPRAVSNGQNAAAFWQEVDAKNSSIYLTIQYCKGGSWMPPRRFAGPFPYSGKAPDLYSAAMNAQGLLAVGVLSDANTIKANSTAHTTGNYTYYTGSVTVTNAMSSGLMGGLFNENGVF